MRLPEQAPQRPEKPFYPEEITPTGISKLELFSRLMDKVIPHQSNPEEAWKMLHDVYTLADQAYYAVGKPKRHSGDETITHSLMIANYLADAGILDPDVHAAAITHDLVEDTILKDTTISMVTLDKICSITNDRVARLVDLVTKVRSTKIEATVGDEQVLDIEQFTAKKLLEAFVEDRGALYIKLADVAHNMETIDSLPDPQKKVRKARLALRLYEPLARVLGLTNFAERIGNNAIAVLRPDEFHEIQQRQQQMDQELKQGQFEDIVHKLEAKWQEKSGLSANTITHESPTIYELFRRSVRPRQISRDDYLPVLHIEVADFHAVDDWFKLLNQEYPQTPHDRPPYTYGEEDYPPAMKVIPLVLAGGEEYLMKVQVSARAHAIVPVDLDRSFANLSDKEIKITEKKYEELQTIYEQVVRETTNPADLLEDIEELLEKGSITVFAPDNEKYKLPAGSTVLDFAYYMSRELGNKAVSAYVIRAGVPRQLNVLDPIQPGDKIKISTEEGIPLLPSRYDLVTTRRAIRTITRSFDALREQGLSLESVKDAKRRGIATLLWLYRCKFHEDILMHLEDAFRDSLVEKYGQLNSLAEQVGFLPIPSQRFVFFNFWHTEYPDNRGLLIGDAFTLLDKMNKFMHSRPWLNIIVSDREGLLKALGSLSSEYRVNVIPLLVRPTHYLDEEDISAGTPVELGGQVKKPARIIAGFSTGTFKDVLNMVADLQAQLNESIIRIKPYEDLIGINLDTLVHQV